MLSQPARSDLQPHPLPAEFMALAEALAATYEKLDLQIETTLRAAEQDLIAALPELEGFESALSLFAALLIKDLRTHFDGSAAQPILLRLAFEDEADLTEQLQTLLHNGDTP